MFKQIKHKAKCAFDGIVGGAALMAIPAVATLAIATPIILIAGAAKAVLPDE